MDPADGHAKHKQSANAFHRLELSAGPDSSLPLTWKPTAPLGGLTAVRLDLVNDTGADEATHLTVRVESGVPPPVVQVYDAGTVAPQVQADWLGEPMEADFTVFSEPAAGNSNAKVVIVSNGCPAGTGCCSQSSPWSPTTDTCTDLLSNPQHCGACLHACGLNETCKSGDCVSGQ